MFLIRSNNCALHRLFPILQYAADHRNELPDETTIAEEEIPPDNQCRTIVYEPDEL